MDHEEATDPLGLPSITKGPAEEAIIVSVPYHTLPACASPDTLELSVLTPIFIYSFGACNSTVAARSRPQSRRCTAWRSFSQATSGVCLRHVWTDA